jgi:hypothetical protein
MSIRVFKSISNNSITHYLDAAINRETISLNPPIIPIEPEKSCTAYTQCKTLTIHQINRLKRLETLYNYNTIDPTTGEYYFDGSITQANYLTNRIDLNTIVTNQIEYNLTNSQNLNLSRNQSIDNNNENLFQIDPSNVLFRAQICNWRNHFIDRTNSYNKYSISLIADNPNPKYQVENKKTLCYTR